MANESVEMNEGQELAAWKSIRVAVTGGTSGLGLALVRMLLDRGARVAFIARNRDGVEHLMRERTDARGITGDVSQKGDIYSIAIQILGELGGLDVLSTMLRALVRFPSHPSRTRTAKILNARFRPMFWVRFD
jgi:NAD(P)-dependent dehydrogenase (short-subunit alcohol dehydrogenase family)